MLCNHKTSFAWWSWWCCLVLLCVAGRALANTETLVLDLRTDHLPADAAWHADVDRAVLRTALTPGMVAAGTNTFFVDLSAVPSGGETLLLFDVTGLPRKSFLVRACWSAMHPVSVHVSAASAGDSDLLAVVLAPDYYSAAVDGPATHGLLQRFALQLTLSENSLLFGSVSPDMLRLASYVATVAFGAVLFSAIFV